MIKLKLACRSKVGKNRTKGQDICDTQFEQCMKVPVRIFVQHRGEFQTNFPSLYQSLIRHASLFQFHGSGKVQGKRGL
jgi:hypothetical protein